MASGLYDKGRNHFLTGDIKWKLTGGDTIKITLVDIADYTPNLATDEFMNTDTVPLAARIQTATLTLIDPTAGIADAEDATLAACTGDPAEAILIWKDGGDGGSSASGTNDLLIAFLDSTTMAGLPITPNGADIPVTWSNGSNKIFKL